MTSEAYLLVLSLSTALQFFAFFISIYALRFGDFRAAWVVVGIVALLMALGSSIHLVDKWTDPEINSTSVIAGLIALSVSILAVVGLSLGLSAMR